MAGIRENVKNGKIVSYRFTVCVDRDNNGKQVRKFTIWTPPAGLSPTKERRAAERAAEDWEEEIRAEYQKEQEAKEQGIAYALPPEKRRDDFIDFIQNTWIPLQVKSGNNKPTTVVFYTHTVNRIIEYFKGYTLQGITPTDIQKFFHKYLNLLIAEGYLVKRSGNTYVICESRKFGR